MRPHCKNLSLSQYVTNKMKKDAEIENRIYYCDLLDLCLVWYMGLLILESFVVLCASVVLVLVLGADDTNSYQQDFAKELGHAITGMAENFADDLFGSDEEVLKVGLGPLDFDGLQMLTDPNLITDPATEDSFKLEHRS